MTIPVFVYKNPIDNFIDLTLFVSQHLTVASN